MEITTWIGHRLDSYLILTYNEILILRLQRNSPSKKKKIKKKTYNEMDGSKENAFQLTSYHIGIYTYSK